MCEVAPEILPTFGHEHAVYSRSVYRFITIIFLIYSLTVLKIVTHATADSIGD